MKPIAFLMALLAFSSADGAEANKFVRLKGLEIQDYIAGHELTDEVHWSYKFAKDGAASWIDLGKERTGKWYISQAKELCVDSVQRGKTTSDCYELWVSGDRFEFRKYGQTVMEGKLFK